MRFLSLIPAVLLFLSSCAVFANGYFHIRTMYRSSASGGEGATSNTRTDLDLGAGYLTDKGWALGLLYGSDKNSVSSALGRTSTGLSGGWINTKDTGGFYFFATYFLSATRGDGATGGGYQVDFGYLMPFRRFSFGPQLSYRHIGYTKIEGIALTPGEIDDRIDPYFTFMFLF